MSDWFHDITKTLADNTLSRREAVKKIAVTIAGTALASWFPGIALARSQFGKCPDCIPNGCNSCSCFTGGCSHNNNCLCLFKLDSQEEWLCGCIEYCASAKPCTRQSDCGKGSFCSTNNGCACPPNGICVQKCTKTCHLAAEGVGRTTACIPSSTRSALRREGARQGRAGGASVQWMVRTCWSGAVMV